MGTVASAVVGGILAVAVGLGLVSAFGGGSPSPVSKPYIVYGQA